MGGKVYPLVHIDGCIVGLADKQVDKVAVVHLLGQVLQNTHQFVCQPLAPALTTTCMTFLPSSLEGKLASDV